MLKIRLQRVGRKHEPTFRVVLTDSKNSTKSGKIHEVLGSYDPRKKTEMFKGERIKEWIAKGAQLSGTMHNLLISHKIIEGKKINVLPRKSPVIDEEKIAAEKAEAEALEAKKQEELKATEELPAENLPEETPVETSTEEVPEAPEGASVPAEESPAPVPSENTEEKPTE
jgi:small subunit ribosomal protein S16